MLWEHSFGPAPDMWESSPFSSASNERTIELDRPPLNALDHEAIESLALLFELRAASAPYRRR
jgi:hypothetical protein